MPPLSTATLTGRREESALFIFFFIVAGECPVKTNKASERSRKQVLQGAAEGAGVI